MTPERYRDAAVEGIRQLLGLREGEPIMRGFGDQLRIAYQNRPKLFARHIELPELLHRSVIEGDERVSARGQVLIPLDEEQLALALQTAYAEGLRAVAIVLMHAVISTPSGGGYGAR